MNDSTADTSPDEVERPSIVAPISVPRHDVVAERHVVHGTAPEPAARRRSFVVPFLAGFMAAVVAGAVGVAVFLAVSDSDDDGEIELDVPAVDLEVGG